MGSKKMAMQPSLAILRRCTSTAFRSQLSLRCASSGQSLHDNQRLHGGEMISGQDFSTGDGVGAAAEVGHLPLGGQVEKGPFFTGDSSNKKKLAPLDTSAGVRGVLDQHADRTFNRPSVQIDAQGIKWNYGDLKAHVDATATGLLELGVEKGDTIALWANSPAEKLLTELSAAVLGASLVEAKSASALSGAKVIVFDGSDSAAAVGAASGVKLQTAGAPVAGAYPFQDIPVYGPLFPDPLDALPASASDILDNKYKQLGAGDLLT